jgi:hypothetical protein
VQIARKVLYFKDYLHYFAYDENDEKVHGLSAAKCAGNSNFGTNSR